MYLKIFVTKEDMPKVFVDRAGDNEFYIFFDRIKIEFESESDAAHLARLILQRLGIQNLSQIKD